MLKDPYLLGVWWESPGNKILPVQTWGLEFESSRTLYKPKDLITAHVCDPSIGISRAQWLPSFAESASFRLALSSFLPSSLCHLCIPVFSSSLPFLSSQFQDVISTIELSHLSYIPQKNKLKPLQDGQKRISCSLR